MSGDLDMQGEIFKGRCASARCSALGELLRHKKGLRVMEVHCPLTALLIEGMLYSGVEGEVVFDAFWSSSLVDATLRGKPDTELVELSSRFSNVSDIFDVTTRPLIFDADTGGLIEHLPYHVRTAERLGISAFVIEDKAGLKKNSLLGNEVFQCQANIEEFSKKIAIAIQSRSSPDFMIIARIESLILDEGMPQALRRSLAYVAAGADGIMIHSRQAAPDEVLEFARLFRMHHQNVPLICVPTTYTNIHFDALVLAGFNVVIYANHMLRAAYPAMSFVAREILKNGCTQKVEQYCLSVKGILELIPGTS